MYFKNINDIIKKYFFFLILYVAQHKKIVMTRAHIQVWLNCNYLHFIQLVYPT